MAVYIRKSERADYDHYGPANGVGGYVVKAKIEQYTCHCGVVNVALVKDWEHSHSDTCGTEFIGWRAECPHADSLQLGE